MNQQKLGRKRKTTPNVVMNPAVKKRSILPTQYNFTPGPNIDLPNQSPQELVGKEAGPSKPPPPGIHDYPPPMALFQNSAGEQRQGIEELENSCTRNSQRQSRPILLKETISTMMRIHYRSFRMTRWRL
ncbi:unnamed protein product [Cochlearia groenlandica]